MSKLHLEALVVFAGMLIVAASATATGSDVAFCDKSDWWCYSIKVINNAAVTVTKVNIKQKDDNGCEKMEQTHKANLSLTESFTLHARQQCAYHIKFVTTDGCTGDKEVNFPVATDEPAPQNEAQLTGGCGTLHASKAYIKDFF